MKCKKVIVFTVCFLFVLACCLFCTGFYFYINSKPQIIFEKGFDAFLNISNRYILPSDSIFIGDTFTVDGLVDFNLNSEYYSKMETLDSAKRYRLIQNLNQLDTHFILMQSKKDKSLFAQLVESIGNEEIANTKLLVDNATQYYFVNQFIDEYINNGTCNYFENLSGENTTKSNIEYLYNFILKSLKSNIMKGEFSSAFTGQEINGKVQKIHQTTIQISDAFVHNVINGVLKDLKKDKRSAFILKNVYKDFFKYKIKNEIRFLGSDEVYTLNIYTSKYFYKPLRYEIVHKNGEQIEKFLLDIQNSGCNILYIKNNKHIYNIVVYFQNNKIVADIFNLNNNKIGNFGFEKENGSLTINLSFNNNNLMYDFVYSSKILKLKKNKSYTHNRNLSFKFVKDRVSILNGNININSNVVSKARAFEKVSLARLSSKLSDNERNMLKSRKDRIRARLES